MNFVASLVLRLVDRLTGPARTATRAVGDMNRAQRAARTAADQWSRGLQDLDARLNRLGNASLLTEGLGRAGQSVIRPLEQAARVAATFEERMTGIGITSQMTDAQLRPLRRTILETAASLGLLPEEVQGSFSSVLAQGIYRSRVELEQAGAAAARLRRLLRVQGEDISDDEGAAFSAMLGGTFGYRANQLDRGGAMINRSAQLGGVSGADLMRALPAQAGSMRGMSFANDIGLADLLAANQVALRGAGSGSEATNNVNNLLAALASPETIRRFGEAGINLEREIRGGVERGISPLESLASLTQRATGGDTFRIAELFGDRQARDAIVAITQNMDEFRSQSAALRDDDVLSAYMADLERATGGAAGALNRSQSAMQRLRVAAGTILAPALTALAGLVERLAAWFTDAAENGGVLGRIALYAAGAFGVFAMAAGAIGNVVVGILGPLLILQSTFGALGRAAVAQGLIRLVGAFGAVRNAIIGVNLAMLANPIGIIIAVAVAAVVALALVIRRYWQPISAFMTGVGQAIWEAIGPVFAEIGAMLAPLRPIWDGLASAIGSVVRWFMDLIRPVTLTSDELASTTQSGRRFGQAIVSVFRIITFPIRAAVTFIRASFIVLRALLAWRPMDTLRAAWGGITGFFSGLVTRFRGFGRALIQGLIGGIRSLAGGAVNAVVGVARGAVNGFRNLLGIRSPSRLFMQLGQQTVQGLTLGLNSEGGGPIAALRGIAGEMARTPLRLASAAVDGPTGQGAASGPAIGTLTQHFHINGGQHDVRSLARELDRLGRQGRRAALHDGAAG